MSGLLVVLPALDREITQGCVETMLHPESAAGFKPEEVLLVNNGRHPGGYNGLRVHRDLNGHNLGVARSWNVGAREVLNQGLDYLVIMSTVMRFGPILHTTWRRQMEEFWGAKVIEADGHSWHLIALHRTCFEKVGLFDENFYPAYFEQIDWCYRLRMVGWEQGFIRAWVNALSMGVGLHIDQVSCPAAPLLEYYCVDEKTEMLTQCGFKQHEQLQIGELIYAIDPRTLEGSWQPLLDVHAYPGPVEVIEWRGQRHSSVTTPNHRWLVERRSARRDDAKGVYERAWETTELCQHRVLAAAPCVDFPTAPKYTDAFVELVAWSWTEGTRAVRRDHVCICGISQSRRVHPDYVTRIRHCLTEVFGEEAQEGLRGRDKPAWREGSIREDIAFFHLNHHASRVLATVAPDRVVTVEFILALTRAQLVLFTETSIDADGTRGDGRVGIGQKDIDRLRSLQIAYVLLGKRTWLRGQVDPPWATLTIGTRPTFWPTNAISAGERNPERFTSRRYVQDGAVWCPEVATGAWLARRDGHTYVTGNSTKWGGDKGEETFVQPFGSKPLAYWEDVPIPTLAERYHLETWW